MEISVVLCTHNPKPNAFKRVLMSLECQDISPEKWELIVVDNASSEDLKKIFPLNWHPNGRYVREEKLGLTAARIRGIKESKGEVIVFVDDDNILASDYLIQAMLISNNYPFIGAWGGNIEPEFESEPPNWLRSYFPILALRDISYDSWSNLRTPYETSPAGAGMCVRRAVVERYMKLVDTDPIRYKLGRNGNTLSSCEDSDLALTSCDMGLGTGLFTSLKMTHVIPSIRLTENYIERLLEGFGYSQALLAAIRKYQEPGEGNDFFLKRIGRYLLLNMRERRFYLARMRGRSNAKKLLASLNY